MSDKEDIKELEQLLILFVSREEYERAAIIRDEIKRIKELKKEENNE